MASSYVQWYHYPFKYHGKICLHFVLKISCLFTIFFYFSGQIRFRRYNISNGCVVLLGKPSIWQSDFRKFAFSYRIAWDWIKKNSMEFSSISKIKKVNFNSCNTEIVSVWLQKILILQASFTLRTSSNKTFRVYRRHTVQDQPWFCHFEKWQTAKTWQNQFDWQTSVVNRKS